jgi:excisionase family DNA binding protein
MKDPNKTFSIADLAREVHVPYSTMWNWVHKHQIKATKYGKKYRVQWSEWLKFLDRCNATQSPYASEDDAMQSWLMNQNLDEMIKESKSLNSNHAPDSAS